MTHCDWTFKFMSGSKYNGSFVDIESRESNVAIVDTDSKGKPIWDDTLYLVIQMHEFF